MSTKAATKTGGGMPELTPSSAGVPRTVAKRLERPQTPRISSRCLAELVVPDMRDPTVVELERRLTARGEALRARLSKEAERLKDER